MKFIKLLLIISAIGLSQITYAQSNNELQKFGPQVFTWLTDSLNPQNKVEFIRIRTWRELIDRQPFTAGEKEQEKIVMQEAYQQRYKSFVSQSDFLREQNLKEKANGATFEILKFSAKPSPKTTDIYEGTLRVIYSNGEVQNIITYTFSIFYNGKGYGLITAPKENF